MAKLIVRIFGGLGNQLFCYAAARRVALISNAELVIDNVSGFKFDTVYKRTYQLNHFNISSRMATAKEQLEPYSRIRRYLMRKFYSKIPFEQRKYLKQELIDFDSRLIHYKVVGTVFLEGYWQSENYFKDVENTLREDLKIVPPIDCANLYVARRIQLSASVAIHVRNFDDIDVNATAMDDYYKRALDLMEKIQPNSHYFIFSDNPSAARMKIQLEDNRITMVTHNQGDEGAYADLWLMSQCNNFIIANSTFSWWGAWLSTYPRKHVIAPGFKKLDGKAWWGFNGLLPDNWIKL